MNDKPTLATEMIGEQKAIGKKWRAAFFVALSLLIVALGAIWYILSIR